MTKKDSEITGDFAWRVPAVIPSYVEGNDSKQVYDAVREVVENGVWLNGSLMSGSNTPLAARVDTFVRPLGLRVATLRDFSRPEVMEMIRNNHYSDAAALILRTTDDTYAPNKPIIETLVKEIETREGSLKLPVMITGYDVVRANGQYGWNIVPREDFAILHDERLGGDYNEKKFNDVDDDTGLPKFDRKGTRQWFARNQGIAGVCLNGGLNLDSDDGDLAGSNGGGRVVLLGGEAAGADLRASYSTAQKANITRLRTTLDTEHQTKLARIAALAKELGV